MFVLVKLIHRVVMDVTVYQNFEGAYRGYRAAWAGAGCDNDRKIAEYREHGALDYQLVMAGEAPPVHKVYVATVQIAVEVDTEGEARDAISNMLSGFEEQGHVAMDWGYVRDESTGEYPYPPPAYTDNDEWGIGDVT